MATRDPQAGFGLHFYEDFARKETTLFNEKDKKHEN
jgi:hypothetical protein